MGLPYKEFPSIPHPSLPVVRHGEEPPPPTLCELQNWFRWIVTDPRGVKAALANQYFSAVGWFKPQLEPKPRLLPFIKDKNPLPARERLSIYTYAYFKRILDALKLTFPAVARALGNKKFQEVFVEYLVKHPSMSPNLDEAGEKVTEFLSSHKIRKVYPFLPDLAQLEWLVLESLYVDRFPPLDASRLKDISADQWIETRLILDPTVRLMKSAWTIEKAWKGRATVRPVQRWLLIYRDDDWVHVKVVTQVQWKTLKWIQEGLVLGQVCDALEVEIRTKKRPPPVHMWFKKWVYMDLIKGWIPDRYIRE